MRSIYIRSAVLMTFLGSLFWIFSNSDGRYLNSNYSLLMLFTLPPLSYCLFRWTKEMMVKNWKWGLALTSFSWAVLVVLLFSVHLREYLNYWNIPIMIAMSMAVVTAIAMYDWNQSKVVGPWRSANFLLIYFMAIFFFFSVVLLSWSYWVLPLVLTLICIFVAVVINYVMEMKANAPERIGWVRVVLIGMALMMFIPLTFMFFILFFWGFSASL